MIIMKHSNNYELRRIAARVAAIEQKCDIIIAQLSVIRAKGNIDELIDRMHRCARSMRNNLP